jgi:hypothetical protein
MALENAPFLLVGTDVTDAPNSRNLTSDPFSSNLIFVDSGPGGNYTLSPVLNLQSLTQIGSTGLTTYLGNNSFTSRSITSPGSISVTNPDGNGGNIGLSVVDFTSTQNVQIQVSDFAPLIGNTLQFIPGTNMDINATENSGILSVVFNSAAGSGGEGTVTSIGVGAGLSSNTTNPITTNGIISLSPLGAPLVPGTYISPLLNVNEYGQITEIVNGTIGNGTVTEIATGIGLEGGPIFTSGTISIANIDGLAAGTYSNPILTVNQQGQITEIFPGPGGDGTVTEIATGVGLEGGPIYTSGTISIANIAGLNPGIYTNPIIEINAQGQIIDAIQGTGGEGTVTEIATGIGLTGGPIYESGTISIANIAGLTPGPYTNPNLTVNQQGQITEISNGSSSTLPGPGVIVTDPLGTPAAVSYLMDNSTEDTGGLFLGLNTGSIGNKVLGIGYGVLAENTADFNTAIGWLSLATNSSGSYNTAVGPNCLNANQTGSYNTALGVFSLQSNTTGSNNLGIGLDSLFTNTTGNNNVGIGVESLYLNITGSDNVAIGYQALRSNVSGQNVAIGSGALLNTVSGGNTGLGYQALFYNTSGTSNVAVGNAALQNYLGSRNTAVGWSALQSTLGTSSSSDNTAVGQQALRENIYGQFCTAVGSNALLNSTAASYLTAIGFNAGATYQTTDNCTFIGSGTDATVAGLSNIVAIGANALVSASNNMVLGGTGANAVSVVVGATEADPSAVLDLESSTQGFLMPRMTSADRLAIPSPVNGLQVYDTTSALPYYYNSTIPAWLPVGTGGSGGIIEVNVIKYDTPGLYTYTPTPGMVFCLVQMCGGGGSGRLSTSGTPGASGGGGGYTQKFFLAGDIGLSQSVTVGAGGAAITGTSANNGNPGGTSYLGTILAGTGGSGGTQTAIAIGGVGFGGDFILNGQNGGLGVNTGAGALISPGGSSFFGPSMQPLIGSAATGNGINGRNYGEGGSANYASGAGPFSSGAGASGVVIITEYLA